MRSLLPLVIALSLSGCTSVTDLADLPAAVRDLADLPAQRPYTSPIAPAHYAPIPPVTGRPMASVHYPRLFQSPAQYDGSSLGCVPVALSAALWAADPAFRDRFGDDDSVASPTVQAVVHDVGVDLGTSFGPQRSTTPWYVERPWLSAQGFEWRTPLDARVWTLSACIQAGEAVYLVLGTDEPGLTHAAWVDGAGTTADGVRYLRVQMGWAEAKTTQWLVEARVPVAGGITILDVIALPQVPTLPKSAT